MRMNITGGATTLSQDAKRQGKETFLADKFSVLLCGWRDAFYVGGNFFFFFLMLEVIYSQGNHIVTFLALQN